jgi:integrating conjugative element protein (TIGR03752 family)
MRSNGLLKWLLIPWLPCWCCSSASGCSRVAALRHHRPRMPGAKLTPAEMKALGIEGDTPRDTVATLVAQVKQLRNELQTALNDNKNQKTENERMRARESAIDQRIQSALDGERGRLQQERELVAGDRQQTQGLLQDLQRRLDGLSGKGGQADLPVGLGLEEGDGKGFGGNQGGSARHTNGTRWVEPDDAKPSAKNGSSGGLNFPTSFGPAQKTLSDTADSVASTVADAGSRAVGASAKPVYTVPSNSTLMGSIAMTALIGRVPIDGTVNDPYPFKVLIGAGQPHRQRHRHSRRGRRGVQRHGLGRLDAFLRARPDALGHVRLQRRHDPHRARRPQSESKQRQSGQQREQHDAWRPGLDQRSPRHPVRLAASGAATRSSTSARRR